MKKSMNEKVRIIIADDHPVFRRGLKQIIEAEPDMQIVGEEGDGTSALERIRELKPEIAILDIDMPQLDGIMVARRIREQQIPIEVIFLTMYREEKLFSRALALDVKGYVLKDSTVTDIVSSIRAVARGEHYTSPALTTYLIKRRRNAVTPSGINAGLEVVTPTERRVLAMIADYKTSKEIAEELCISRRTVETHRANICHKLEIHGSHALMKFALEHKSYLT